MKATDITKLRKKLNLTQSQLCALLQCHLSSVKRWEAYGCPSSSGQLLLRQLAFYGERGVRWLKQSAASEREDWIIGEEE